MLLGREAFGGLVAVFGHGPLGQRGHMPKELHVSFVALAGFPHTMLGTYF